MRSTRSTILLKARADGSGPGESGSTPDAPGASPYQRAPGLELLYGEDYFDTRHSNDPKRLARSGRFTWEASHRIAVSMRAWARQGINRALSPVGLELVRRAGNPAVGYFIPMKETVAAAQAAGLSVTDYVDTKSARLGATQETIDWMAERGAFDGRVERVVEIGPGSGRYLGKTIDACHPDAYEIYEPAADWERWLQDTYGVSARPADGRTLSATAPRSADLVHAHKVFVYTPFLVTCRYWREMVRVLRAGGTIVFDIVTEGCMDDETVDSWLATESIYPCLTPRQYAIDFFARRGFDFRGSFFVPMTAGRTECLTFRLGRRADG